MDISTIVSIIGGILILLIGVLMIGFFITAARRRTERLQDEFGPEYDRAMEGEEDRRAVERDLQQRLARVEGLDIRSLTDHEIAMFTDSWRSVQAEFVESPDDAADNAEQLLEQVLETRGYPKADFEQRVADISVNYPEIAGNYRSAFSIMEKRRISGTSTEQLRQALIHYKLLFEKLVGSESHVDSLAVSNAAYHEMEREEEPQFERMGGQ